MSTESAGCVAFQPILLVDIINGHDNSLIEIQEGR
jgi:hypothetical protein